MINLLNVKQFTRSYMAMHHDHGYTGQERRAANRTRTPSNRSPEVDTASTAGTKPPLTMYGKPLTNYRWEDLNASERTHLFTHAPETLDLRHTEVAAHGPVSRQPSTQPFMVPTRLTTKGQALHDFLTRPI